MKIIPFLTILYLPFLFSCGDITYEMWLEKDGSGKMHLSYDMGEMLSLFEMFSEMSDSSSADEQSEKLTDLLDQLGQGENFDTTIQLYDFLKEESTSQNLSDAGKKIHLNLKGNKAEQSMLMTLKMDYKNFKELDEILNSIEQQDKGSGMPMTSVTSLPKFSEYYKMTPKSFEIKPYTLKEENPEINIDSLASDIPMDGLFDTGNMVYIYHFPYKIKSCSDKKAEISGQTLTIRQPLSELMKMKQFPGLTVKFKK